MSVGSDAVCCLPSQIASFVPNICRGHMDIPKRQERSAEERIGSMIGKIFVLALIAFFVWGHCRQSNIRRTVGVDSLYTNQKLERTASIRADA